MEIDKDWFIDCYRLSSIFIETIFVNFYKLKIDTIYFLYVFLSHSIVDMQCKCQQAELKEQEQ